MTRKDLLKLIDDEVKKVATEPIREPVRQLPETKTEPQKLIHKPALKDEIEINHYLFKAGMKD
jgi:hypothetical protein